MPQSLSRILIHLVFSTKGRERILTSEIQAELYPYLIGTLDHIDCTMLQIGGMEDHVHLFFGLSRARTIAEVAENLKTSSSKWIKPKERHTPAFIGNQATAHFLSVNRMLMR